MTTKICTDIDQSKKLIEWGIDVNTADMFWLTTNKSRLHVLVEDLEKYSRWDCTPAWSLAALLSVLPTYLFEFDRGIDLNVYPHLNGRGWHCSYMPNCIENMKTDKFKLITNGDTLVDACVAMIEKLHEQKLL